MSVVEKERERLDIQNNDPMNHITRVGSDVTFCGLRVSPGAERIFDNGVSGECVVCVEMNKSYIASLYGR